MAFMVMSSKGVKAIVGWALSAMIMLELWLSWNTGSLQYRTGSLRLISSHTQNYLTTVIFSFSRSYEAEIKFLKTEEDVVNKKGTQTSERFHENLKKVVCRANCNICNDTNDSADLDISNISSQDSRWLQYRGCFLSVGAAVISCRNERAPEGLVAEAHLSDGFLHLILIKDCPRPFYLW